MLQELEPFPTFQNCKKNLCFRSHGAYYSVRPCEGRVYLHRDDRCSVHSIASNYINVIWDAAGAWTQVLHSMWHPCECTSPNGHCLHLGLCTCTDIKLGVMALSGPNYMNGTACRGIHGTPAHHCAGKLGPRMGVHCCMPV